MKKSFIFYLSVLLLLQLLSCSSSEPQKPSGGQSSTIDLSVDNTRPISKNNRIIYELNLYDFTNAGTLQAATNKLPDLSKLGVDIIWLMPVHPRGTTDRLGSLGSPYAPKDYYSVNSDFGTLSDLQAFVKAAHAAGMEVWLDWVANHTSTDAVWTTAHPEYYVQSGGKFVHPSNYPDVYQLNMSSVLTQNAMIAAMEYWIDQADIDGFRCDYVSSPAIPADFWTKAVSTLKSYKSGKTITMLGEADFSNDPDLYNCGFDYDYAWVFNSDLQKLGGGSDASTLKSYCSDLINNTHYTNMDRMVYLTNHDLNASSGTEFTLYGSNVYALTVLEFTLYGMPLIYNGQEIGFNTVMSLFEKTPITWYNNINNKMNNTIRTLVALKHTQKALADGTNKGSVVFLTADDKDVLAYVRKSGNNEVAIILNLGPAATVNVSGLTGGTYTQWLNSSTVAGGIKGSVVSLSSSASFSMDANGYRVYVLNN